MKNSYEGVTDGSTILAFINSLEVGQLLHYRLLRERNEGKLTLNSMISITSNYAAADDDASESLKAYAIQNTRKQNSNKRKSLLKEQHTPDMWQQPSPRKVKVDITARMRYQRQPATELHSSRHCAGCSRILR
jgi:hypothetical protein